MSDTLVDPTVHPAYILRTFVWQMLVANELMTPGDYPVIPIVPINEEPELQDTDKPYIVYGYSEDTTADLYAENSASMTLAIYDHNFRRLTKILNTLRATFERRTETASEINKFSTYLSVETPGFLGIRFGDVRVGFIEGGTPEEQEGGKQSALFNIRFTYFVKHDIKTWQNNDWV